MLTLIPQAYPQPAGQKDQKMKDMLERLEFVGDYIQDHLEFFEEKLPFLQSSTHQGLSKPIGSKERTGT
jgi:hypothetical protein